MFGDNKHFRTRLCPQYARGRCVRANCNFAHGDAELRRFSGASSFNGRQDHRGADLREKLDRRNSPYRRNSPGRDARSSRSFRGRRPILRDKGISRSSSPIKGDERKHTKKQHMDGETDDSESFRISSGTEDRIREHKVSSYGEKDVNNTQMKQLRSDIKNLEDRKLQLEISLEDKADEAHKLSKRNEDLEVKLKKEHEDCKRFTLKIKKIVRAHKRYLKAQEELKRSQAHFESLVDQLGSDILKPGPNEEDSSINVPSDLEMDGGRRRSPRNHEIMPVKKRSQVSSAANEELKTGTSQKRRRFSGIFTDSDKFTRPEGYAIPSETNNKVIQSKKEDEVDKSQIDDSKTKRGNGSDSVGHLDKVKSFEVPSTSIAAHALDELTEDIEPMETSDVHENGSLNCKAIMLLPPPPPVNELAYKQYEGDDEDVDVEKVDYEIDLNSEVEQM